MAKEMSACKKLKEDEDILGKLDKLHSDIIANHWEHLDAQDVSQLLALHQSCDFEQPISDSGDKLHVPHERDICLVKLSIITILFDKLGSSDKDGNDNKDLQDICKRLLHHDCKLLECLDHLFGSCDQLVAYTACRTAASVVVSFPTEIQPLPKTWLQGLLQQVKDSPHSRRAVCTFDLFKLIIRGLDNTIPNMAGESACASTSKGTVAACFEMLDENWDQLAQLYLKDCHPLAEEHLGCQQPTSSEERDLAFLALLSLWVECLNSDIELETLKQLHNSNILLELVPALKYTKSSLVYTNILEILSQSLLHDQEEASANSEAVTSLAYALLNAFDDEMMERVPWQDKHVGFGGTDFTEVQLLTGQKPGDWVLVQALALVLLKACSIVSGVCEQEESGNIVTSLQRLSSFVCKKLAMTSKGLSSHHGAVRLQGADVQSGPWLFELFSDQDDSMIEAMLCLLDIHTAVSRYVTDSPHADIMRSFNPYCVFLLFLETTTWDHSILLDLLISMETCFLAYITRYLHLVITEWELFHRTNQLYGTSVDTSGCSVGGLENDKPECGQSGEKNMEGVFLQQSDHTCADSLNVCSTQQTIVTETDDDNASHHVQVISCPEPDSFDMAITGPLQDLGTNVVTQQSKTPPDQDVQDAHHSPKETSEREEDKSSSQSSDDSSSDHADEESTLDKTMGVLIRLRLAVERLSEKKLFPYNVSPLLRLLSQVEAKYEED